MGTGVAEADDLVDEDGALGASGMRHALFDHVRRELVLRKLQHFTAYRCYDPRFILGLAVLCNSIGEGYILVENKQVNTCLYVAHF